jgi:hypothetical protein
MRKFKMGLIALAATAAVAVPATSALAGTDSAATTSSALGGGCVALCNFSVLDGSNTAILSGIDVNAAVVACPNVNVIGLLVGQKVECKNSQHTDYKFIQRTN